MIKKLLFGIGVIIFTSCGEPKITSFDEVFSHVLYEGEIYLDIDVSAEAIEAASDTGVMHDAKWFDVSEVKTNEDGFAVHDFIYNMEPLYREDLIDYLRMENRIHITAYEFDPTGDLRITYWNLCGGGYYSASFWIDEAYDRVWRINNREYDWDNHFSMMKWRYANEGVDDVRMRHIKNAIKETGYYKRTPGCPFISDDPNMPFPDYSNEVYRHIESLGKTITFWDGRTGKDLYKGIFLNHSTGTTHAFGVWVDRNGNITNVEVK